MGLNLLHSPLNPVYSAEQAAKNFEAAGHDANQIGHQVSSAYHVAENIVQGPEKAAHAIGSITTFVTSGENWIRIGEVIAGVILIVMGLRTLAGHDTTPVSAVTGTVKTAAKVAR